MIPYLVFEFLSKNRMSFQQTERAATEYFGISRQEKITKNRDTELFGTQNIFEHIIF